jgi:predicted metalloprotease with PDZ domain
LRGRGYTTQDFERVASEVTGLDLRDFFERYTRDVETLPYDEAFRYVGLTMTREQARQPYNAGIRLDPHDPSSLMIAAITPNSPAENAGLQEGDEITSLGKKNISRENFLVSLGRYKQGDRVPITVQRDRKTIQTTLVLGAPERFEYRIAERPNATPEEEALRTAWLQGSL